MYVEDIYKSVTIGGKKIAFAEFINLLNEGVRELANSCNGAKNDDKIYTHLDEKMKLSPKFKNALVFYIKAQLSMTSDEYSKYISLYANSKTSASFAEERGKARRIYTPQFR